VHDAEDAFQAVFLVLVRKAGSIRPAHMVGNWLHGVAYRTAMNAKANRSRRKAVEAQCRLETAAARGASILEAVLDEELERLPAKYRAVLVQCDLEGKTRREAARQLDCPEGTVAGRLARARALLARRLTRRGLTFCGGALALEVVQAAATAAVPGRLLVAAIKTPTVFALGSSAAGGIPASVLALTKGVLNAMLLDKLKLGLMLFVVVLGGLAVTATGLPLWTAMAAQPGDEAQQPRPTASNTAGGNMKPPGGGDPSIQGVWSLQHALRDGKKREMPGVTLIITNHHMIWQEPGVERALYYRVDTAKNPKQIDLILLEPGRGESKSERVLGVYAILADTLVIHESDGPRPRDTSFDGTRGSTLFIYRRVGSLLPAAKSTLLPVATAAVPDSATWGDKLFLARGPTSHNFGKLPRGDRAVHRFHLKNIYSVPMEITDTRMSCGCVSVTAPVKHFAVNAEGYIDVQVDTRRFTGTKTITIFVGIGGDYASTATLRVSVESVDEPSLKVRDEAPRGKIINIDDQSQLVELNIGSDRGVKQKQVLDVFRLQPRPEYLGKVRIISVQANRAVGRIVTPSVAPIVVGDEVGGLFKSP
jgi:RNA polymerase sigma factor (sigma-70 family)